MNESDYPRVLIIRQSSNTTSGGGITLSNLFRGWPKDRLAIACGGDEYPDSTLFENYYNLGSLEDRWIWPFNSIKRQGKISGPVALSQVSRGLGADSTSPLGVVKTFRPSFSRRLFYASVNLFGTYELMRQLYLSPQFLEWVNLFKPDLIYTWLHSINVIRLVERTYCATGVPLVIHIVDDWPAALYRHGLLAPYVRHRMDVEFRALLACSSGRMGIGNKMCQVFEGRYGLPFEAFHNTIDISVWRKIARRDWVSSTPFRVVYTGGIGPANRQSLADAADAVAELFDSRQPIMMDIFTPNWEFGRTILLERPGCVYVNPAIPYRDMPITLAKADLLLLPLDFSQFSVNLAQYSIPTKMPEYMASGTPILVYAPEDMALSEYARNEGWAKVISERNKAVLRQEILNLMRDPILREQFGRRGQEIAARNHDAIKVRETFRLALTKASAIGHQKLT